MDIGNIPKIKRRGIRFPVDTHVTSRLLGSLTWQNRYYAPPSSSLIAGATTKSSIAGME